MKRVCADIAVSRPSRPYGWMRASFLGTMIAATLVSLCGCSYFASRRVTAGPFIRDGEVVFRYYAPAARQVQLAGDWPQNNWARGDGSVGEANIGLMTDADGDGVWEIAVALVPGRYKYLFWVDEHTWHVDPGNLDETSGGPFNICSQIVLEVQGDDLQIQ